MHDSNLNRFIDNWISLITQFRLLVVVSIIIITVFSIWYIKDHLGMSTETRDMLSEDLKWRQLDIEYERVFTETLDNVLIVIESNTPDQARHSARSLFQALKTSPKFIEDIYYPADLPFFKQSAFLFMTEDELYDLSDRLTSIQPFIGTLLADKTIRGLFGMLEQALQAKADGDEVELQQLIKEINSTLQKDDYRLSWQRLMQAEEEKKSVYREYIITKTLEDPEEFLPGESVIEHINKTVENLQLENKNTTVRLTGGTALSYEELKSVAKANIIAILGSLILVTIILIFGLDSVWLFFSSIMTLILGLIATTALAAATVGTLNLISVAFAVLYIGLGIDFAIHLCLRYREAVNSGQNNIISIQFAVRHIFRTLCLCALTTSIGFYSFMPTDYQGVAELGWIAGCGMLVSLIYTFTVLPAFLSFKNIIVKRQATSETNKFFQHLSQLPYQYPKQILTASIIVVIISIFAVRHLSFDSNTLNLQNPDNESVQTYQDLLKDSDNSPWHVVLLPRDKSTAIKLKTDLQNLDIVEKVVWLDDLIPDNQDDKLFVLDELNLIMGPLSIISSEVSINAQQREESVEKLLMQLNSLSESMMTSELETLNKKLMELKSNNAKDWTEIETRLLFHLGDSIKSLETALTAESVSLEDIPESVKKRWLKEGYYKLEIYPAKDLNIHNNMIEFVTELQKYNNTVIGAPVVNVEAGKAVINAFQSAMTYALLAITLLLFVLIKSRIDVILILSTLFVGAVLTAGMMVLIGIPMNFANIIGLPLLLGIGVDSGIHIANRFRYEQTTGKNIFLTSAFRGVIVSSLTTIFSIGNLAFSGHTGTASMGIMLTVGLFCMMFATVVFLPSLLILIEQRNKKIT